MWVKVSAPGSLMLLGEHAILQSNHVALVCAIDQRMTVTLVSRDDTRIILNSALGHLTLDLSELGVNKPPVIFEFVLTALASVKSHFQSGCEITIESEFSATIGFASSAAVTVAILAAVLTWRDLSFSNIELIERARTCVRTVQQGFGSGADVAACVMGGMIAYRAESLWVEKLAAIYPISVIYSGNKTPTVDVIKIIQKKFSTHAILLDQLYQAIHQCAIEGIAAAREFNWKVLGDVMNIQQGLMDALGVNTPVLNHIVEIMRQDANILGAKISGSGLGDCVVGLGVLNNTSLKINMTAQGVLCEKE